MALVTKNFTLNVTPGAMPPTIHVSEYDVGRAYNVTFIGENGNAFEIPTGTTATVEGTLNGTIGFTTSATISNNQISFTLTESMTAYAGKARCKIKLTQNSQPIQTCAFILAVDRAGVEAKTVIGAPGFEKQIQNAVDTYLDEHPVSGEGWTDEMKTALLACFQNVAWINDQGQTYYDALYSALYGEAPPTPILPSTYQQVEYIANPSNAYMVTSIAVPLGYKVHGKAFLPAKPNSAVNVCGGLKNWNASFCCFSGITENSAGTFYGNTNCFATLADLYASPLEFTTVHSASSISIWMKNSDGENSNTVSVRADVVTALNVFRASSDASNPFVGRIYLLEVLDTDDQAAARLIPCYRKADGVVGMYDTVNNSFYTSANSTAFTKGGDVS